MTELPTMPLLVYEQIGPRVPATEIVRGLAPWFPRHIRAADLPNFTANHPFRARVRALAHGEFSDAAAAAVLMGLLDGAIHDAEATQRASDALYIWSDSEGRDAQYRAPGAEHLPRHPIDRAVVGCAFRGETWMLSVDFWRCSITGQRTITADCHDATVPAVDQQPAPSFYPMAAATVILNHPGDSRRAPRDARVDGADHGPVRPLRAAPRRAWRPARSRLRLGPPLSRRHHASSGPGEQ
ncbi:MAG: hypothetical protein ACE368_08420 [Paracoccaceae bacterium]